MSNDNRSGDGFRSSLLEQLQEIHARHAGVTDGQVATYIPELAKADPKLFGICLVTATGHVYEVGDTGHEFTIQSISKPFVYGLALEDNTRAEVLKRVGVEPTGEAFNAISLEPGTGRPRNPMINAGAIAAAGMIAGKNLGTRQRRMLEMFSNYAGRELALDERVYRSESETGHRNRAIGHMLRNFDILTEAPEPIVDLYFRQCSVSVTCRDLGVMAATLANRGINPLTGRSAIRGEYVESLLSVMGSCGMYDYAGEWLYRVGMPAKSGVSGGVMAVLPGQLGIGVYSPPLDARGNSVRGLRACDDLSRVFDLHLFNTPQLGKSVVRLRFSAAEVNSSRYRTPAEAEVLREHGGGIQVFQLQGSLMLSTTEVVENAVIAGLETTRDLILDFKHVLGINECACRLLFQLLVRLQASGRRVLFTNLTRVPSFRRYLKAKLEGRFDSVVRGFDDNDTALEWCENRLLAEKLPGYAPNRAAHVEEYEPFQGLTEDEIGVVAGLLERRSFVPGEVVVESGAPAAELFVVARGSASVAVPLSGGSRKRLATFSAGMAFGEMAVLDGAARSAAVTADTELECDLLKVDDLEALGESHPRIRAVLLKNLALGLSRKLRKANREISVFDY